MHLAKLKEIAEARSPGDWSIKTEEGPIAHILPAFMEIKDHKYFAPANNALFIATMANHIDGLLAVVGAAKERAASSHNEVCAMMLKTRSCSCGHDDLVKALEVLEEIDG